MRRQSGTADFTILLVFGLATLVFTAVGAYFAHLAVDRIQEGWQTRSWPLARGEVLTSGVTGQEMALEAAQRRNSTGTNSAVGGATGKSVSHWAAVTVAYEVDGVAYRTNRLSVAGNQFMFGFLARWAVEDFPEGATVPVSYNPQQPDDAVLEPGLTFSAFGPLAAGIGIIIGVWFLFVVIVRSEKKGVTYSDD
ncbi:MAG: DUF3592 domain-containing protein [Pseudomonadota bacterium]